jgi:hypothetical protein
MQIYWLLANASCAYSWPKDLWPMGWHTAHKFGPSQTWHGPSGQSHARAGDRGQRVGGAQATCGDQRGSGRPAGFDGLAGPAQHENHRHLAPGPPA